MKVKSFLFVVLFTLFAKEVWAITGDFNSEEITSIRVVLPKGTVEVLPVKNKKNISGQVAEETKNPKCLLLLKKEGTVLLARVESENVLFEKANCKAKIKLEIPEQGKFDLSFSAGSADIKVGAFLGDLDYQAGAGSLFLDGDLLKNVNIKAANSNIILNYKRCEGRADIDLMAATGETKIELPSTCKIRVNHKSATGSLFNELGDSKDYQVLVNSKTANGDLKILKKK